MSQILNQLEDVNLYLDSTGFPNLWNLFWAIVIILAGRWLARRARNWFRKAQVRLDFSVNESLLALTESILYYGILLTALMLSLSVLGIPIDSFLLLLAIVVIILAIVLQSSLNNFAATIIFTVFQTFKQGDWIETMDAYGQVEEMQMFSTVITATDKSTVIIPNGEILQDKITNYSRLGLRRLELLFTIAYEDDIRSAKQILYEIMENEERILVDPEPVVGIIELGDDGVEFTVRPYVEITDYMPVKLTVTEQVKLRFDEAGITIPFPQRDVHINNPL